jgi:hypothetical protein
MMIPLTLRQNTSTERQSKHSTLQIGSHVDLSQVQRIYPSEQVYEVVQ